MAFPRRYENSARGPRFPARGAFLLFLLVSAPALGCAASSGTSGSTSGSTRSSNRDVITREELATLPSRNLYEAVQMLRPLWLRIRSARSVNMRTEIAVVQDGMYLGPAGELRWLNKENVQDIRYMNGPEAAALIPGLENGRAVEGAILVRYGFGTSPDARPQPD